jgi:hypothetical protein
MGLLLDETGLKPLTHPEILDMHVTLAAKKRPTSPYLSR